MAEFKLVIADPKTGKSYQKEIKDNLAKSLVGKKIKEKFNGELLDLTGYEFKITGGSDHAGFPLRADLPGTGRRKVFTITGVVGVKKSKRKGTRVRKTVCAGSIFEKTVQLNTMIVKAGKAPIEALQPKKEAAPEGEEAKKE